MMSYTVFRMLRRSIVAIIACAAVLILAGCGVKGPLKLPPGQTAPAPTGLPPGAIPATTSSDRPAYTPPPPPAPASTTPDENKDQTQ
jgi:predicted small lipoprotein YifL